MDAPSAEAIVARVRRVREEFVMIREAHGPRRVPRAASRRIAASAQEAGEDRERVALSESAALLSLEQTHRELRRDHGLVATSIDREADVEHEGDADGRVPTNAGADRHAERERHVTAEGLERPGIDPH